MTRKTIIGIVIAMLALAFVVVVAVALARAQPTVHALTQIKQGAVGPSGRVIGPEGAVGPFGRLPAGTVVVGTGGRIGALGGFALALVLLVAGGIGGLIVYLVRPTRPDTAAATVSAPPAAGPGPRDAHYQEFVQWQQWRQFEDWHRQMHAAATAEQPTVQMQPQAGPQAAPPQSQAEAPTEPTEPPTAPTGPQAEPPASEPAPPDDPKA
jgi:hypothetical protein